MKIVSLTPGTGSFHCGSCLRDEALVRALRAMGHDATMVPMYLPLVLDDPAGGPTEPVRFGGINVYLQQKSAFFRYMPRWIDRIFDSNWMLRLAAKRAGMTRPAELYDLTISMLFGEEGRQRKEIDKLIDHLEAHDRPDVVCLSNALLVGLARRIRQRLGVPVICTLQGEDSFLDSLPHPHSARAWAVLAERAADVDMFIAISQYFRNLMQKRLALPDGRVQVVYNGINTEGFTPAAEPPAVPTIGYLARMNYAKGLHALVDAFILLRRSGELNDVRLKVAGAMTPADEAYLRRIQQKLTEFELSDAVEFLPNITREEKLAFLRSISVLSVPASYGEAFGLYLLEAMAAGVPVVQPRSGAFPELLEATGGGILVDADDPQALAEGIESLLKDPQRARTLGRRGREAVLSEFSAERMAENFLEVCRITLRQQQLIAEAAGQDG